MTATYLVVDGQLTAIVVDDQDADATVAVAEGALEALKQAALVEDGQALLDVARLRHGDDVAVVANVKHAVLFEDGAEHVLDKHRRAGVADEARFLIQLLGEEVDAKVAVLACLRRRRNADDLARSALQDQQVADADMVARDRDSVRHGGGACAAVRGAVDGFRRGAGSRRGDFVVLDRDFLLAMRPLFVVVMTSAVDGVEDAVGDAVQTVTERMILALFVVISHVTFVRAGGSVNRRALGDVDLVKRHRLTFGSLVGRVVTRASAFVLPAAREAGAVLAFGYVDTGVDVDLGFGVAGVMVVVEHAVPDVNLGAGVSVERLSIATIRPC